MSWFDTSGLASFAKTALKEAQKTLDKALDIKDDVEDGNDGKDDAEPVKDNNVVLKEPSVSEQMNETSIWGSFTGSYFEVKKSKNSPSHIEKPTLFPNGISEEVLAPLATPESELTPIDNTTGFPSKYTTEIRADVNNEEKNSAKETHKDDGQIIVKSENVIVSDKHNDVSASSQVTTEEATSATDEKVCIRTKTRRNSANRNSYVSNRLSVVSNDSEGRKSSESVEVVGSSVSGATSPESELPSISTSSSMGLAPNSSSFTESVEVLDSLASPSSVEVIPESGYEQDVVVIPPVTSPGYSTDSVEVIEDFEEEDSYASLSESTGTTMFSHVPRMTDSCQDLSQASSRVLSGDSTPDVLRLMLPSHGSCDLLSESIQEDDWESPLMRGSTCSETDAGRPSSTHGSPVRRLSSRSEERHLVKLEVKNVASSMEDSQQSGGSAAIDSSCEGTLMGSSSDEGTINVLVADKPQGGVLITRDGSQSASPSCYMKHLLAEAMGEESYTRATSPTLSEKSRSDVVKVGSEQTSGHTSGDELETATSSDIEIISRYSPNGDSSSTASRHSPAKMLIQGSRYKLSIASGDKIIQKKIKGHQREPSEASSGCSEDNSSSETDKLSKKIAELTEVLEAREGKLVELSRSNLELQEKNIALKKQLEVANKPQSEALHEKDIIIQELTEEGEKLSKQQLKHSNTIKALKKQEQAHQIAINSYKKQVETLTQELEATKKKLTAKEEMEKNLVERVGLLTNKVGRQDKEITGMVDQIEKAVVKAEQLRINLDDAEQDLTAKTKTIYSLKKEIEEMKQLGLAATKDRDRLLSIERTAQATRDSLSSQIEELRLQLKHSEQLNSQKEAQAREEKKGLLRRLDEAESRNEELAQSVSLSTRPLLKQLEALKNNIKQQRESWELRERELLDKLDEAEAHARDLKDAEKGLKLEVVNLKGKDAGVMSQLMATRQELERERALKNDLITQTVNLESEMKRTREDYGVAIDNLRAQLNDTKRKLSATEEALATQRAAMQEAVKERERSPPSSPTLSFGHGSLSESISSTNWPQFNEENFETASVSGRYTNVYDSVRIGSSSLLEGLQAQLKMRDGETAQLQWELHRRDAERSALTAELASLSSKVSEQEEQLLEAEKVSTTLAELQRNYDALLQMHGEKVEEVEELRLDLQDVKEMYKAQIEQLIQKGSNRSEPPG